MINNPTKFKETELGPIPEEWDVLPLTKLADVVGGGTPRTNEPKYWNGSIPWLSVVDFNNESKTVYTTEKTITEEGVKNSSVQVLKKGSLIISARGTVGALTQLGADMAFNQSCYGLVAKSIPDDLLYYLVKNSVADIQKRTHGSVFDTITRKTLEDIKLSLPSDENEQKQIAEILSSLDDKIELNRKINKTLESIGQAIFKRWFVDDEIPKGWHTEPLDKNVIFLNGLALQKYPAETEEYLPAIKIRELNNGVTEATDKVSANIPQEYLVSDGDVLFAWSGSLDVVIWSGGKGALNQHLFKVTSEKYPKWFYYFWTKHFLPEYQTIAASKAVTMGHIKREHLAESIILVPDGESFKKINALIEPVMQSKMNNSLEIGTLSQIRDSLLPRLMSGKIRVNL